ncbi:MAG: hypothetical protein P0Y51_15585 [Candidatus Pseudomonas colombiensis]|nr:MAG: hypothetical protein P0Y51_15585 [Pseudomonas sp.]
MSDVSALAQERGRQAIVLAHDALGVGQQQAISQALGQLPIAPPLLARLMLAPERKQAQQDQGEGQHKVEQGSAHRVGNSMNRTS